MILDHQKFDYGERRLIEKVTIKAPFRFAVDFPNDACFIYFEEGSTKVNAPYEQVAVNTGDSILLKCGTYFSDLMAHAPNKAYEIIVVHLPQHVLQEIYHYDLPPKVEAKPSPYIQKPDEKLLIREFIKSLHFYFDNPAVVSDELLALKLKELILLLMKTQNASSVQLLFQQLFTPQEIDIREVVNSHLFSDMSVEDLAYLCHMSESTFKRKFKKVFSDSPANYIKSKRLQRAKELLSLGHLSVSEIAFSTCFNDVAHFSRSFKAAYGCSPSEYKQKTL